MNSKPYAAFFPSLPGYSADALWHQHAGVDPAASRVALDNVACVHMCKIGDVV